MYNEKHTHNTHSHHSSHPAQQKMQNRDSNFKLAFNATVHCLSGCFLGEILGLIISLIIGLGTIESTLLAVAMGFVMGLFLGVLPLIKAGYNFNNAIKIIILAEGISIAVMEGFEVLIMILIPGVMDAGIFDILFWSGMIGGLAVGFIAALPINYLMIKRGIRHSH
jgi:hypothetical protein